MNCSKIQYLYCFNFWENTYGLYIRNKKNNFYPKFNPQVEPKLGQNNFSKANSMKKYIAIKIKQNLSYSVGRSMPPLNSLSNHNKGIL